MEGSRSALGVCMAGWLGVPPALPCARAVAPVAVPVRPHLQARPAMMRRPLMILTRPCGT
jgi:hypothetical protein